MNRDFYCRICQGETKFIQRETRAGLIYNICKCYSCNTYQTVEHYAKTSPDYIDLTARDLTEFHIEMSRGHKRRAHEQFFKVLNDNEIDARKNAYTILDVGCGTGGFSDVVLSNKCVYYGFDSSKVQVEYAKNQGLDVFQAISFADFLVHMPRLKNQVDVVTGWDVFEHIRDPLEFLRGAKMLLKDSGLLFLALPGAGGHLWKKPLYKFFGKMYSFDPWEHVFYYSPKSLRLLLEREGYDIINIGSVVIYDRDKSAFEILRKLAFLLFKPCPSLSPQIYVLAKKRPKII